MNILVLTFFPNYFEFNYKSDARQCTPFVLSNLKCTLLKIKIPKLNFEEMKKTKIFDFYEATITLVFLVSCEEVNSLCCFPNLRALLLRKNEVYYI